MTSAPAALNRGELREIVARTLDVETAEVTDKANFVDDLNVDSLMALEVVVVLEKHYGVRLRETEVRDITCLDSAYDLLTAKLRDAG